MKNYFHEVCRKCGLKSGVGSVSSKIVVCVSLCVFIEGHTCVRVFFS